MAESLDALPLVAAAGDEPAVAPPVDEPAVAPGAAAPLVSEPAPAAGRLGSVTSM